MSTAVGRTPLRRAPTRRRRPDVRARHPSMAARRRHPATLTPEGHRRRQVRAQLRGVALDDFRPDVEGMRAIAVVVVLLFHLRIGLFSGGFVGVDVFFVLSGFLITRLLLTELAATGTLALPNFWARRARRLLPASVLVLVTTVVVGRWMLPPLAQRALATDATAAAAFIVNFGFAHRLGDYFESQLAPSPLLHFWSLAVEEQFYLIWPLVLIAATSRPRQYRRLLVAIIVGVAAISLLVSVWLTARHPTWAFYLLPARMGELLAGAAVAAGGAAFLAVPARFRAALGWFGLFAISVAVLTYDPGTVFPGYASMLPVLGTVLVIAAGGAGGAPNGPVKILRHPVGQWLGARSYAIYLWHWPALVLVEARFGPQPLAVRVVLVGASIGLATVSWRLVENPVRHSRWLAVDPRRGLALGATLCTVAITVGGLSAAERPRLDSGAVAAPPTLPGVVAPGTSPAADDEQEAAAPAAASLAPLPGGSLASLVAANRSVLEQGLATTDVPSNLRPSLSSVGADRAPVYADGCVAIGVETELRPCRYGPQDASITIVLYGDSHAAQWSPALIAIAEDRGYELVVVAKGGCPVAAVSMPTATLSRTCPIWRDAAIELIADERPDVVVLSQLATYPNADDEWAAGFAATMDRLAPLAGDIVVLGDNPPASGEPVSCLSNHLRQADECASPRADVVESDRLAIEHDIAAGHGAGFVDTTDWLCTDVACPLIIGDILLYRDITHITTVAAEWFRPLVEASLQPLLP